MKRTIVGLQIICVGFEGFSQALFTWKKSTENIAYVIAKEAMDGVGMNDEIKGVKNYGTQQP